MSQTNASDSLYLKLTQKEFARLALAAEQRDETVDEFVLRRSLEAAEIECCDASVVLAPSKDGTEFETWMRRPPEASEALVQLTKRKPSWRK